MKKAHKTYSSLLLAVISIFAVVSCSMEEEIILDNEATVTEIKVNGTNAIITISLTGILSRQQYEKNKSSLTMWVNGINDNNTQGFHPSEISKMSNGTLSAVFEATGLKPLVEYEVVLKPDTIYFDSQNDIYFPSKKIFKPSNNIFTTGIDYSLSMKAIDLGLSVLWGESDLGTPSTYTIPFDVPLIPESENLNSLSSLTSISGTRYDIATVSLGNGWRTPTVAEWEELCSNCNWQSWKYYNKETGVVYRYWERVFGKDDCSENYIDFFPKDPETVDYYGRYWTSDRSTTYNKDFFTFYYNNKGYEFQKWSALTHKFTLRPVKDR